jgi:hypothetical protein
MLRRLSSVWMKRGTLTWNIEIGMVVLPLREGEREV